MNRFDRMMESNPKGAIREVEKFKKTLFWEHFHGQMEITMAILTSKLRTCELSEVKTVRAQLKANEHLMGIPDAMIEALKDIVAMEEEAEQVDEARRPDK